MRGVPGGRAGGLPLRRCVRLGRFLVRDGSAAQPRIHRLPPVGSLWGMPLLFLIPGRGARYAMRTRSAAAFARARLARLLVPFAFGLVLLVPRCSTSKRSAGKITAAGGKARFVAADLTDPAQLDPLRRAGGTGRPRPATSPARSLPPTAATPPSDPGGPAGTAHDPRPPFPPVREPPRGPRQTLPYAHTADASRREYQP